MEGIQKIRIKIAWKKNINSVLSTFHTAKLL